MNIYFGLTVVGFFSETIRFENGVRVTLNLRRFRRISGEPKT
jgi:hypothetical protein